MLLSEEIIELLKQSPNYEKSRNAIAIFFAEKNKRKTVNIGYVSHLIKLMQYQGIVECYYKKGNPTGGIGNILMVKLKTKENENEKRL